MENVEQCCVCFWRSSSNLFSFLAPIDVHTTYMNIIYAKTGKLTVSCCSSHSCDWITVVILFDIEKFYLIFQYLCNICSSHSDFWNNNCQLFQTYDKSLVLVSVSVCLWIYDKVNIWSRKELLQLDYVDLNHWFLSSFKTGTIYKLVLSRYALIISQIYNHWIDARRTEASLSLKIHTSSRKLTFDNEWK